MGHLIKSEEEILELREKIKDKKLILTNGCFDILHIGHIRYLREAKLQGDYLLIGVNSDQSVKELKGSSRPLNNQFDRAELLNALSFVDFTYIFEEKTAENLIELCCPDIYVKGGDYELGNLPEHKVLNKLNIQTVFISFVKGYSTTSLINKFDERKVSKPHPLTPSPQAKKGNTTTENSPLCRRRGAGGEVTKYSN